MPDQNQNNQNPPKSPVSVISPQSDLPPMPPAFQNVGTPAPTASGAPAETTTPPPPSPQPIISMPKKKFGGGRIIATILGLLLLVGGVGAGIFLTQQPQLFQQQAAGNCTCASELGQTRAGACSQSGTCLCPRGYVVDTDHCTASTGGGGGGGGTTCTPSCSGKSCGTDNGCGGTCAEGTGCNYCSGTIQQDCTSGCTPNSTGGTCTQTTAYCSDLMLNDCAYGCTPTPNGGQCKNPPGGGTQCSNSGGSCAGGLSCCTGLYCITSTHTCSTTSTGSTSVCSANNQCAAGYSCSPGANGSAGTCVANTSTSCKTGDLGAPICCTAEQASSCANKVCEPGQGIGGRQECNINGTYCTIQANSTSCGGGGGGGTTTTSSTAQCSSVLAYDSSWNQLSSSQLSTLAVGTNISFCVAGTTTGGGFDMAKFTINGTAQADTTTKGQKGAASSFCQSYSVPTGTTSFNVTAQIHDSTLGWSN